MRGRTVVVALAVVALAVIALRWYGAAPAGWTQEMRDAFLQSCATSSGTRKPEDVKYYCECTLHRIETSMTVDEYRQEEAVMTAGARTPSQRMTEIAFECLGVDPAAARPEPSLAWTADDQRRFLIGCIPAAKASLGADDRAGDKAARYCRCALAEAAGRMTADAYRALEREAGSGSSASGPLRDIATACASAL